MNQQQFLDLNKEIGQLPPDLTIRNEYMERKFQDLGLSKESGYKSVQYFYSELYKAKEKRKTIFPGKVVISNDHFGIVDKGACIFKMEYERFRDREPLFFPKITIEELKQFVTQIDFNQSLPEYYTKKQSELFRFYHERRIADKEYLKNKDTSVNPPEIGDIVSNIPDWSDNPIEAFEQFRNYFAYKYFLLEVVIFLKTAGNWNQKPVEGKLKKLDKFIIEAEKEANFYEAAEQKSNLRNDKQNYILLAHDYYLNHSVEKDWSTRLELIYARYILFKELLEKKIKTFSGNDEKTENVKSIEGIKNNFDNNDIGVVYEHFYKLVEKKYLSENDLILFIELAFEKRKEPIKKFKLENVTSKQKIIKIFYFYFKNICQKPHGKQKLYASLLGEYFEGYSIENVSTNFSK